MRLIDTTGWTRMDFVRFYTDVWDCAVIPIAKSKKPLIEWTKYQTQLPTDKEYEEWFVKQQPWGLAFVLSHNLFSIDCDTLEVFKTLKQAGAFGEGCCIHKSARGSHVVMRADVAPFAVKEHNPLLGAEFWELGIGGDKALDIAPDTPQREWVALYDEPFVVPYESWLKTYLNYDKEWERLHSAEIKMNCPYHNDEHASLFINPAKGVFHCFGCPAKGTLTKLLDDSRTMGFSLPEKIWAEIKLRLSVPIIRLTDEIEEEHIEAIIDQFLEGGENATAIISGVSGIGKTTLGLSLAIPLSQGKPVLGVLAVPKAKRVAYINFEQRGTSIAKQAKAMQTTLGEAGGLIILDGRNVRLWDKPSVESLWNTLVAEQSEVLIMDSIQSFVKDYNSKEEADEVRELASKMVDELHCAVIFLHHTASGESAGRGVELAKGTLGKMLAAFCATKLLYSGLPEEKYYGRLEGTTRAWDVADWCIAYEGITRTAAIADWRELDKETREGLGRPFIADLLDQGIILARKLGKTKSECAEEIGIDRRSINFYLKGEQYPSGETEQKIRNWIDNLKAIITGRGIPDAKPIPTDTHLEDNHIGAVIAPLAGQPPNSGGEGGIGVTVSKIKNYRVAEMGLADCAHCPLKGRPRVEGYGVEGGGGIMLVGEAPGEDEAKAGTPFVGRAGRRLDELLDIANLRQADCYVTNTCLCHPPKKGKKIGKPTSKAIKCCLPRLQAEVERLKPKRIFLLGDVAVSALLPDYSIARYHGKKVRRGDITYIIMYHPSAGLRNPFYANAATLDFERFEGLPVVSEIEGEYSIGELSPEAFEKDFVCIDTETAGLYGGLLGGAISLHPGMACFYPNGKIVDCLNDCPEWRYLLFHNAKYDLQILEREGYKWEGKEIDDTMLLAYCMGYPNLHLKVLETQELNVDHKDCSAITAELSLDKLAKYCCQDTDTTVRLWGYLWQLADDRERWIYENIEKPLLPVLIDMERKGVRVDLEYVRDWRAGLDKQRATAQAVLEDEYGLIPKQISSPKQLGEWLVKEGIKLPKTEQSTQYATGKEILASVMDDHPAIPIILRWRQLSKLISTYADACLELTDKNGIIHSTFSQARVATARLSSSEPNLQNLPHTLEARRPFIASPGCKLVSMDYSQIDMRAMAAVTGDEALMKAYQDREMDIHNWLADRLFGDHEPSHRYVVKSANYLSMFLGTAQGLHTYLNAPMGEFDLERMGNPPSLEQCRQIIRDYYDMLQGLGVWQGRTKADVLRDGYVEDYFGRRRYIYKVFSGTRRIKEEGFREAVNFPIAGTAAELFKLSTAKVGAIWTPSINIHDELIFDIPEARLDELVPKLQAAMQDIAFPVPLVVKYKIGNNLGELI